MEKVRSVALLELTVTFDEHDLPLRSRRSTRNKSYPGGCGRWVWSVDIESELFLSHDHCSHLLPVFVFFSQELLGSCILTFDVG